MNAAMSFEKKNIAQQSLLTLACFAAYAGFAPALLRPEETSLVDLVARVLAVGAGAALVVAIAMKVRLGAVRYTLRALALGSKAVEPAEIDRLRRLPNSAVVIHLVVEPSAIALLSAIRPREMGGEVGRELVVLGVMTVLATTVPALVLAQSAVARLLELAPLDAVEAHLDDLVARGAPRRLSRRNLTLAVAIPVALVGVGGALASYAHLRAITDESRKATATTIGRSVVGTPEPRNQIGQRAAIEAAKKFGYGVKLTDEERHAELGRMPNDELVLRLPLEKGSVTTTYRSELGFANSFSLAAVALGFAAIGIAAALSVARLLSRDLTRAAERLRTLGTEEVLHGGVDAPVAARFQGVGELARAALALADRFRVFAAAQERALEAKETARRMRGLFFASVSHDLKSPLNAILGFADSIDRDAMTASQTESLDLIATRGRELVALIETILDAARVEAGQLKLNRRTTKVATWLPAAARMARDLAQDAGEVKVEIAEGLPDTDIDPVHLPRALAVVIAHALRAPTQDGTPSRVTVRASLPARERRIRIEVDHGNTTITATELSALFARQASSRGRGLTLGLSLSRSVFELHKGSIEVHGEGSGAPLVLAYVPPTPVR